ncbi:hypothetical protein SAMN02910358_01466 [Lachnospiraceae bacterium XBB1006]|nr:hypothetical protein SAMN02910358_01466 [Lachnospiraceae bacterium XBB1006]
MNKMLERKTKLVVFVEKNEFLVKGLAKLVLMLTACLLVHFELGFFQRVHVIAIPIALAVIGAFVPMGLGTLMLAAYLLINLYGLGVEVCVVALVLLLLCFTLYFRFAPGRSHLLILTPVCWMLRIPYFLPVTEGLVRGAGSVVPVMMGTVMYYYLRGLRANTALFTTGTGTEAMGKVNAALNLIMGNKELWLVIGTFLLTALVVSAIRRRSIRNAWRVAIYTGVTIQTICLLFGKLILGNMTGIVGVMIGSLIGLGVDIAVEFFLFQLDYSRVERVQFEDDFYYYYVKAVPKVMVRAQEKKVTTFGAESTEEELEATKEKIAKELEIDPNLLK